MFWYSKFFSVNEKLSGKVQFNPEIFSNAGILTFLTRKSSPRPSVRCWTLLSISMSSHPSSSSCCRSCRWSSCTPWWAGSWWLPPGGDNLWWLRGTVSEEIGATRQRRQSWRCWVRQKFPIFQLVRKKENSFPPAMSVFVQRRGEETAQTTQISHLVFQSSHLIA